MSLSILHHMSHKNWSNSLSERIIKGNLPLRSKKILPMNRSGVTLSITLSIDELKHAVTPITSIW